MSLWHKEGTPIGLRPHIGAQLHINHIQRLRLLQIMHFTTTPPTKQDARRVKGSE